MTSSRDKLPAAGKSAEVEAFLRKIEHLPVRAASGRGRLIFAMDATAFSMVEVRHGSVVTTKGSLCLVASFSAFSRERKPTYR